MNVLRKISYTFGGKFLILNLFFLIISFFCIASFIKHKIIRFIAAVVFSLITVLQICSLYILRSFIDYSFIIHFNTRDVIAMMGLFKAHLIACALVFLGFFIIYFNAALIITKTLTWLHKRIVFTKQLLNTSNLKYFKIAAILLAVYVMCLNNGVLQKSYALFKTLKVENKSFKEQLNALNMNNYVFPKNLEVSSAGKNIIVISLESYEKGYLSEKHAALTPFLRSLKENPSWQYYDMNQNEGSKWTSGSLYTYLTGFPAYFGTMHNNIFQSSYHSNITGLGHILQKSGYKTTYIGDDAQVSGTQDMLYTLKIDNIIDKSILGDLTQDKDLFDVAKKTALDNSKTNTPFSLFISTLSTHFPSGIYDKRMEPFISPKASDIEFMAAATDYMLKDFINYLKEIGVYKNTIIYIFPDHLKMGEDTLFDGTGERGLFILTNAKKTVVDTTNLKNLYQIDLPNIILKGAEIKTNATFLSDYISGDKNAFIQNHISDITALNIAGFERSQLTPYIIPKISEHVDAYKKDTLRFIAHAGGKIDNHIYTNSLEALNANYAKGFRLFELDIQTTSDGKFVAAHYWEDWVTMTGYTGETPVSHKEFMSHKLYETYTPLDMKAINSWFKKHPDAILVSDKINTPKAFASQFIDSNRLIMELFSWDAVREATKIKMKAVMPSQNVLFDLKKHYLDSLQKYHIKHVALSRNIIASNQELLQTLKKNNIKVYAYNITDYIDRDEMYVVKHEMDFIYGIYADEWSFLNEEKKNENNKE